MITYATPIDPRNLDELNARLEQGQHGCWSRKLSAAQVLRAATVAEERVNQLGLDRYEIVAVIHPEAAESGTGPAQATAAILERTRFGWSLISAGRVPTRNLVRRPTLGERMQIVVQVEQTHRTLDRIGQALNAQFVAPQFGQGLLTYASRYIGVALPGERRMWASDGRGGLIRAA